MRGLSFQGFREGLHQRGAARPAQRGEEGVQHASSPRKPPLLELTPELTTAVAPLLPAAQHIGDIGIQLTGPFPLVRAQGHAAPSSQAQTVEVPLPTCAAIAARLIPCARRRRICSYATARAAKLV